MRIIVNYLGYSRYVKEHVLYVTTSLSNMEESMHFYLYAPTTIGIGSGLRHLKELIAKGDFRHFEGSDNKPILDESDEFRTFIRPYIYQYMVRIDGFFA